MDYLGPTRVAEELDLPSFTAATEGYLFKFRADDRIAQFVA